MAHIPEQHWGSLGQSETLKVLHYEYYGTYDYGPGGDEFVPTAKSDVRDAFRPVVKR